MQIFVVGPEREKEKGLTNWWCSVPTQSF
jgi:hypothetical protein